MDTPVVVLCISADLPFVFSRFCSSEGVDNVVALSAFRHPEFGRHYDVTITTGALQGLMSRAVVVVNPGRTINRSQSRHY